MSLYRDVYQASLDDPAGFWREAAREVSWTRAPQQILDATRPPFYRWFPDAELNTCANALDRHIDAGRGEQQALIYDSPVTGTKRSYTYAELLEITSRFAGVLCGLGVSKRRPRGDLHADDS
ncbi:MAG: propionyl-CoA synthetase [Mycobacterium sp.]|nr:propionyl-CoA synthetase [Mycobacterium sp.]